MFSIADMPHTIPVFPLAGAMLLPRGHLPLRLFEPRYLAMFEDVLKTPQRLIGMVQPNGGDSIHAIGCAGRVTGFTEGNDGSYGITLTGISRFTVVNDADGFTAYRKCDVDWDVFAHDMGKPETDDGFDRAALLAVLARYFETEELETDWSAMSKSRDEMLINSLSMLCPFGPADKQALLEAPTLTARRVILETLLQFGAMGGKSKDVMQ